jgi:hypothetical protein
MHVALHRLLDQLLGDALDALDIAVGLLQLDQKSVAEELRALWAAATPGGRYTEGRPNRGSRPPDMKSC